MKRNRPPSPQTLAVLLALSVNPQEWRHGYDLCREVGLKAGSMYPILIRLADIGWLETAWETQTVPGRPARHLYRLTALGLSVAAEQAQAAKSETGAALAQGLVAL